MILIYICNTCVRNSCIRAKRIPVLKAYCSSVMQSAAAVLSRKYYIHMKSRKIYVSPYSVACIYARLSLSGVSVQWKKKKYVFMRILSRIYMLACSFLKCMYSGRT